MWKPRWNFRFYTNTIIYYFPYIRHNKLLWKDKYESPRCEREPAIYISWLWFNFQATQESDEYWEQWLWIKHYCDGDEAKAKETWGWVDENKESTWEEFR